MQVEIEQVSFIS